MTFCSYTVFSEKKEYVNSFSMRHDSDNELLSDAIHIVYVELSKLGEIIEKSVGDMNDLEKWAIFFRYAGEPEYREAVNRVIESKEELQMAGNLLMGISQDERERAVFRSRKMYQTDLESNLATAEERGISIGEKNRSIEIARKLIKRSRPIDEIAEDTGLSRQDIEQLMLS